MAAVSPQMSSPPPLHRGGKAADTAASTTSTGMPIRRLFLEDEDEHDDDDDDLMSPASPLPSVSELLREVGRLHSTVRQLEGVANADIEPLDGLDDSATATPSKRQRGLGGSHVGIARHRRTGSLVGDDLLNRSDLNLSFSSDAALPEDKSESRSRNPETAPKPTRIAALTRENISLLRAPQEAHRARKYEGSVTGSHKSRTSARTDGGAVFSRLYQPDYFKNRDMKLKAMRDRQESFNIPLAPRITNRSSLCSRNSVGSSSASSMLSAKTDGVSNVSSRLYDPEYMRKRSAKLQRMREERELRNCTFTPTVNASSSVRRPGASTPSRK